MPRHLLSDAACSKAKPRSALYYLSDGEGLRLQVRPNGAKYWMLRFTLAGAESTAMLGSYPSLSLRDARSRAEQSRAQVREGRSPVVARKLQRHAQIKADRNTFASIAQAWLDFHKTHWSPAHHERNEGLLRRVLLPTLGPLPPEIKLVS